MRIVQVQMCGEAKNVEYAVNHQWEEGLLGNNTEISIANVCQSCYGSAFQCERQSCPYGMGEHV
jgi:hypothetical protein